MENKHFYIRYRIYTNRAPRSGRGYPVRLVSNIQNLHNNIQGDHLFWNRSLKDEPINARLFIPEDFENVNPYYFKLIKYFTEYFDCYAIWKTTIIKGTTKTINTFVIYGHRIDLLLAYHYTSKIINNLNDMRYNMQKEYRRVKINKRRRGEKVDPETNATVKASNYFYRCLDNLYRNTDYLLEDRFKHLKSKQKLADVELYIRNFEDLDWRAYNYGGKPKLKNVFSRKNKFQNKRIIR